jgi:hypothetical protein
MSISEAWRGRLFQRALKRENWDGSKDPRRVFALMLKDWRAKAPISAWAGF